VDVGYTSNVHYSGMEAAPPKLSYNDYTQN
jgi:hypothetical protein